MTSTSQTKTVLNELTDLLGSDYVSTRESDKLVYSTDWSWMLQMWLDRGMETTKPDFIVHPGSAEDVWNYLNYYNVRQHRKTILR
jgi:alkyldihydroxyacetonephosphate synthase